ncbi:hypothetical protein [Pseudomonas putida]|uniref:hypothetical protein n=1 Tax=Pseudomonas putida TaxID=303 RepID=UPI0021197D29|nr:hypothetical protein [Pseudomonas putida]
MDSTIRDFFSALNEQEGKTAAQIKDDNLGLLIRSAITELDWYSYNYHIKNERTEEQTEQLYILRLGVLRLTHVALDSHESFAAPAFMYIRNKDNASKVLEVASALGFLQHGRRVAQAAANGVCTITKNNDHDFSITLPAQIPDPEFYETQLSDHYKQEYEKL